MNNEVKSFFEPILKEKKRVLAIDFGSKQIGFAISSADFKIAFPLIVIENKGIKTNLVQIQKLIKENNIGGFIIGLPQKMSGIDSDISIQVQNFSNNLKENINLPQIFWDERFSSQFMQKQLINEFDMSRGKRKKIIDKLAASYFLQGALDYFNNVK